MKRDLIDISVRDGRPVTESGAAGMAGDEPGGDGHNAAARPEAPSANGRTTQPEAPSAIGRTIQPDECVDTEQVSEPFREKALREGNTPSSLAVYLLLGLAFGVILVKSEVASWFRIQEMFRFDSIHMFGVIGVAVATAAAGVQLIKRMGITTLHGEPIRISPKEWGGGHRYWLGGTAFGLGWALLGACPGPLFALMGSGVSVLVVALGSALAGTWTYGYLRPRLPH